MQIFVEKKIKTKENYKFVWDGINPISRKERRKKEIVPLIFVWLFFSIFFNFFQFEQERRD